MLVVITLRYIIVLFNSSFLWKWNDHGQRELLRKNEKGFHFENVSNIENDKNFGIVFFGLIGKIYSNGMAEKDDKNMLLFFDPFTC